MRSIWCGNPVHGFACAHCSHCNTEYFIPFSCKGRGFCPSCSTRTMVRTAAHLIEHVLPLVQMRQWVISFPFRIRMILLQPIHHQNILNIVLNEIRNTILTDVSTSDSDAGKWEEILRIAVAAQSAGEPMYGISTSQILLKNSLHVPFNRVRVHLPSSVVFFYDFKQVGFFWSAWPIYGLFCSSWTGYGG